ncbi:MAG: efflux RND transporter permease subunit, partial [Gemmatimonadota bacterium]
MTPVQKDGREYKEFGPSSFAVDHPTSVLVLIAIILIAGLYSYLTVPKEAQPDIEIPTVAVNTLYPGVAPADIESLISRPIEEEINKITDVKTLRSTSVEGYSSISVEFQAGVDMTEALQQVREKVDIAKPELPEAAEEPAIIEFSFSDFPIMQVNVAGDYDLVRLKKLAEDLQDRIEQIPTVLDVKLSGGLDREVQVDVDLAKLKFYGVSFDDVIDAIRDENVTTPAGTIDVGDLKYLVRVPGEYEATQPLENIVVSESGEVPVYIRDIATVDFGFAERDSYARLNDKSVVTLSVTKRTGENIIETSEAVRAVVAAMEPDFPPTTEVSITSDGAKQVRVMVSSLENSIISGLILVVAVLLFALGARTASFVGVAIPLSMFLSFSVIQLLGMTMNMIVLFSLILALGMLVDNAIVIVENIYRYREEGYDQKTAAKLATGEVAMPVMAATATTLAAFAPMLFWPGMIGSFMSYLPKTLIITLTSSLFVGLIINPTLCSLFMRLPGEPKVGLTRQFKLVLWGAFALFLLLWVIFQPLTAVMLVLTAVALWFFNRRVLGPAGSWVQGVAVPRTLTRYERALRWSLGHRWWIVGGAAGSLVAAVGIFMVLNAGIELFPEDIPPDNVWVQIETPTGTRAAVTDEFTKRVEASLAGYAGKVDYESVVATTGMKIGTFGNEAGEHYATIAVALKDYAEREADGFATLEWMRDNVGTDFAGAIVKVDKPAEGPESGLPVTIEIAGEDVAELRRLGDRAVSVLSNAPVMAKLDGLQSDLSKARPELEVEVDREKAKLFGLSTAKIGRTVRSAINGTDASEFRDGEDEYDIVVRLAERYRSDLNSLDELTVVTESGTQVPLPAVATWHIGESPSGIKRKDLDRVVTVSADVRAGYNANAVLAEAQQTLEEFSRELPTGYTIAYTGQQQDQAESEAFLFGAFVMAIFLIGMILVSQFDSVFKPLIILSTVMLSTIGVLIGLVVFRMPFGIIMTGVGVISLAGIVVNNAIVLVDYISILRKRDGMSEYESLIVGGLTRFRPVVLTAVTTIMGLVPLAIGLNFDFEGLYARLAPDIYWGGVQAAWWGPMAIAVIAGLAFATFLTLILVPVMHSLIDDLTHFVHRNVTREGRAEEKAIEGDREADREEAKSD